MAEPVFGEGTILKINDGASSAFVAVDDTTDITPPDEQVVVVDRNRISATTIVERAFSNRKDPGQLTFTYEGGVDKFMRIEALKNVPKSYQLIYPDGLQLATVGRVIGNAPQGIQGGVITSALATVQLTSLTVVSDES